VTTIYVTHGQVEAMTMGDRIAVMKIGVLRQATRGLPANLIRSLHRLAVMNLVPAG
jgi:ABC-type sugar transport system ATPase subunit